MTIGAVLDQKVTVQRVGAGSEDDFGDATEAVTGTDEYMGRVVPVDAREVLVGRDTVIVSEVLWLEPRAVLAATDRVIVDGEPFELMGGPIAFRGIGPTVHHIEAPVRRIVSG